MSLELTASALFHMPEFFSSSIPCANVDRVLRGVTYASIQLKDVAPTEGGVDDGTVQFAWEVQLDSRTPFTLISYAGVDSAGRHQHRVHAEDMRSGAVVPKLPDWGKVVDLIGYLVLSAQANYLAWCRETGRRPELKSEYAKYLADRELAATAVSGVDILHCWDDDDGQGSESDYPPL